MFGLVLAGDLVLLLVFWETTSILSFFLIASAGGKGERPATRALLVTGAGGLALLLAVVLIAATVGSTDIETVLAARLRVLASPVAPAIGGLLILAAFTKSAQVPFHFWLPGAMVAITPVSAYLHAATMVKAGIYLLTRFSTLFAGRTGWALVLIGTGLVTALLGAVLALREHDLKALLAYSTVSQLGLLVAAIGVGTTVALAAAILHTFAHALFKATLFMLVGIIDREAGSRDIRRLSGLMRVMPVTATLTGLAGLSLAGVAPLIGFVSKESLFQGFAGARVFPGSGVVTGALAVAASALTFSYGVRIFYGAFAGPTLQRLYEPSWAFLAPAAVAAVAGTVLGPAVTVLNPLVRRATLDVEPWERPPHFSLWHGFSAELLMSGVTIGIGLVLFLARAPVDRALQRLPSPVGEKVFDSIHQALIRLGNVVGRPDRRDSVAAFLARPVAGVVLLGAAGLVLLGAPPDLRVADGPADRVVLALLTASVIGVAAARSALAAVALLGAVGLVVTVWFLLAGGPDVALTLLLVEILTAMIAAFVLRDLPRRFPRTTRRVRLAAGVAAALAGLAAATGTAALTGRGEPSAAGEFFLRAAEPRTGGRNVVNTILVDFRGLDTLGETSVLAAAALGLLLLPGVARARAGLGPGPVLGPARRLFVPVIGVLSAYLFLRGHNEPGGGFAAALVGGIAIAFGALVGHRSRVGPPRSRAMPFLSAGLLLCSAVGLFAMALGGPFLTPLTATFTVPPFGAVGLSSSLLFDLGVYLLVFGLLVTAVGRLGGEMSVASEVSAR
nr:hydrogen gas-evolving membrane-bound hydrogenase subunit E [Sphaerisporangium rubeum]